MDGIVSVEREEDEWWNQGSEYRTWYIRIFGYKTGQEVIEKTEEEALEAAKMRFAGAIEKLMQAESLIYSMWLNKED